MHQWFDWRSWDFSAKGLARVVFITITGSLGMMAIALATVSYTTRFMDPVAAAMTVAAAILIPIVVSGPVFYFFASKLRENAIMHEELARIASQDSLTTCLNRGAFITLVDAYLSQVNSPATVHGSFLVVDADHFKHINDEFGHAVGDQALRLIVGSMKSTLRSADLLGRIGGEEFAVLLPHTEESQARTIAERMRAGIESIEFHQDGRRVPLSVSIGGVRFGRPVGFSDLHETADRLLYSAKRGGRNRVEFSLLPQTDVDHTFRSAAAG